ncbi:MAG: hypothetical protein ACR2H1_01865 [Limisphaerales bacterium]
MRLNTRAWFLLSLIAFVAAGLFWRLGEQRRLAVPAVKPQTSFFPKAKTITRQTSFTLNPTATTAALPKTNAAFQYRLSNTSETIGQLIRNDKAILLRNALIDTSLSQSLVIPEHLRAKTDPESYIVQARGLIDDAFRNQLQRAGAEIISYIPNNAYLVRASASSARKLAEVPQMQAVLPYEP